MHRVIILVVIDLSIDVRGEWAPNCDDEMLVSSLAWGLTGLKIVLEFYKRYVIHVGFSITSGPGKDK